MMTLFDKIKRDERHIGVAPFISRTVHQRCFGDWSLAFRRDPLMGSIESFSAIVDGLTGNMADGRLREQIRKFARLLIEQGCSPTQELQSAA